jgi:hypothetical protein
LFAVVDAWAVTRWSTLDETELQLTTASLLITMTLNATLLFLYGWLMEAVWGATLGKALVGIRVVRTATAQRSPLSASALRNVLRIVDGFGLYVVGTVVAGCSGARQRIGDIFAQTAVIEDSFGTSIRMVAIVLWTASLAGAGWAVPRICSANYTAPSQHATRVIIRIGKTGNSAYVRIAGFTPDVYSTTP